VHPAEGSLQSFVVEEVNRLVAEGRLGVDELRTRLTDRDLRVLQQKPGPDTDYPRETYERLVALLEYAESSGCPRQPDAERSPVILGPHGTVAHEVLRLRVLLIKFDPADKVLIWNLAASCRDLHIDLGYAAELCDVPRAVAEGDYQVALLDASVPGEPGLELLARNELVSAPVPVAALIRPEDEPQALHLGSRDYLVKGQLDSRLLARTLRGVHDRHCFSVELLESREREHYHATRDSMTGLPNRCYIRDQLQRALDQAAAERRHVSVLFLDLDGFKKVNDRLGHAAGDQLLLTVCERVTANLDPGDILARVGGDEFLVLLQRGDPELGPAAAARQLLAALSRPIQLGALGVVDQVVTASIGIASSPRDGRDPDALIHNADAALYRAKAQGRNRYELFDVSANAEAVRRVSLEQKLRQALDDQVFRLYYQPRVRIDTGQIVGSEALLRWEDPEWGWIAPDEFIPVAEESGLIGRLGAWVLHAAFAQLSEWQQAGFGSLAMSVNVSAHQILENDLRETVLGGLWDSGVDPSKIEVEITESVLVENPEEAARALGELKEIGLRLALDDFGTGFSSLSYLKRFPVDTIKIDQCFVRDVLYDPDDASIIEAIISIAEKLRLDVVAEGVETVGQRDYLFSRGCREMQGFLFSPALPPERFVRLLRGAARG